MKHSLFFPDPHAEADAGFGGQIGPWSHIRVNHPSKHHLHGQSSHLTSAANQEGGTTVVSGRTGSNRTIFAFRTFEYAKKAASHHFSPLSLK